MSEGSSSAPGGGGSERRRELDESLLNMDIDAAEKHMKERIGDHANWSHEKLLKLFYRK